jgi:hypothetical protein
MKKRGMRTRKMILLHRGEISHERHSDGRLNAVVVLEPEATMASIPFECQIAGADEFAGFAHGVILP